MTPKSFAPLQRFQNDQEYTIVSEKGNGEEEKDAISSLALMMLLTQQLFSRRCLLSAFCYVTPNAIVKECDMMSGPRGKSGTSPTDTHYSGMPFLSRITLLLLLGGVAACLLSRSNDAVGRLVGNLEQQLVKPPDLQQARAPPVAKKLSSLSPPNKDENLHQRPQNETEKEERTGNATSSIQSDKGDSPRLARPSQEPSAPVGAETSNKTSVVGRLRFTTPMGVEKEYPVSAARTVEPVNLQNNKKVQVDESHYVFSETGWDASPVVVEEYKLIFFTVPKVGCTVFKQLFRKMMGKDMSVTINPHDINVNGLKLLSRYPKDRASDMLVSPEWTKAIFVREPKKRVLSAFLEKRYAFEDNGLSYIVHQCCRNDRVCQRTMGDSFQSFLWLITQCNNDHWNPQAWRMEGRYWAHINFVGHLETAAADTKALLQRIGAWEKYGSTGWGKSGQGPIFASNSAQHQTGANDQMAYHYTAETERLVENLFQQDYRQPLFNFTTSHKLSLTENATARILRSTRAIEQTHEMQYPLRGDKVRHNTTSKQLLSPSDFVYRKKAGGAPIVIEKYKLIFFPMPGVESTTFLKLCRRMMGYDNWKKTNRVLPHDSSTNGLRYLWNMTQDRATKVLESRNWTKALFVRDPKDRLLSVYLSKSPHETSEYIRDRCCPNKRGCVSPTLTFDEFVEIAAICRDPLWLPQSYRMEGPYWPYINFVGHLERAQKDTKELLTKIGAWEKHGKNGWGNDGTKSVFADGASSKSIQDMASVFYTSDTEKRVEEIYTVDYKHDTLGLAQT